MSSDYFKMLHVVIYLFLVLKPEYSRTTKFLTTPGHQQPWYRLCWMLGTRKIYLHHLSDLNYILWDVLQVNIYHNDDFSSGDQLFRHVTEIAFILVFDRTRNPGDMMFRNTCRLNTDYSMAYYVHLDVGQFWLTEVLASWTLLLI